MKIAFHKSAMQIDRYLPGHRKVDSYAGDAPCAYIMTSTEELPVTAVLLGATTQFKFGEQRDPDSVFRVELELAEVHALIQDMREKGIPLE